MKRILRFEIFYGSIVLTDRGPLYTLRGYPNRPDGKHRYEAFDWEGLPPLGSDTVQTSLF